ncbi:MAG: PQQ-dependent sugar dehydrogenase, partial [Acidimicrobiia bacterium]
MAARPGTDELYVTQRPGIVRRVVVDGDRFTLDDEVVLDVTATVGDVGLEGGLLGIVFAPDGSRVYMGVTSGNDVGGGRRQLVEYTMTDDGIDVASMRPILDLQVEGFVHMGGGLAFGPDGFLYVGLGDGAPFLDGNNTGQDPSDLFASILRIDPLHPQGDLPYSVPEDNPFADGSGAPEVWMFGVRNPWRFSFDADTGDLWIGDVGDAEWEEVDFVPANDDGLDAGRGANLGWSLWEGSRRVEFRKKIPAPEGHVGPLYEYEHGENACAVIGGYVYHGGAIDGLDGTYVFSDLCGGTVLGLDRHDE